MSAQSCLPLWDSVDRSPPGFSVHGILQARRLEWAAISRSRSLLLAQKLNPRLLHCRQLLPQGHSLGSPLWMSSWEPKRPPPHSAVTRSSPTLVGPAEAVCGTCYKNVTSSIPHQQQGRLPANRREIRSRRSLHNMQNVQDTIKNHESFQEPGKYQLE